MKKFKVIETIRHTYACRTCGGEALYVEPVDFPDDAYLICKKCIVVEKTTPEDCLNELSKHARRGHKDEKDCKGDDEHLMPYA